MFKSLKNIQTSFELLRLIVIITLITSTGIICFVVWHCNKTISKEREKIYVLDQGKSLILALQQDVYQNRPVEIRNHVKTFHELFYNLSPDAKAISYNVSRALHLADESTAKIYDDLTENGFYTRLISTNSQQRILFDSISIDDMENYPYTVTVYARLYILRESNITTRTLISTCQLTNEIRSDNNPHGLQMRKYRILNNKTLETVTK